MSARWGRFGVGAHASLSPGGAPEFYRHSGRARALARTISRPGGRVVRRNAQPYLKSALSPTPKTGGHFSPFSRVRMPVDFRPLHGLRHTFASVAVSNGVPLSHNQAINAIVEKFGYVPAWPIVDYTSEFIDKLLQTSLEPHLSSSGGDT